MLLTKATLALIASSTFSGIASAIPVDGAHSLRAAGEDGTLELQRSLLSDAQSEGLQAVARAIEANVLGNVEARTVTKVKTSSTSSNAAEEEEEEQTKAKAAASPKAAPAAAAASPKAAAADTPSSTETKAESSTEEEPAAEKSDGAVKSFLKTTGQSVGDNVAQNVAQSLGTAAGSLADSAVAKLEAVNYTQKWEDTKSKVENFFKARDLPTVLPQQVAASDVPSGAFTPIPTL